MGAMGTRPFRPFRTDLTDPKRGQRPSADLYGHEMRLLLLGSGDRVGCLAAAGASANSPLSEGIAAERASAERGAPGASGAGSWLGVASGRPPTEVSK